MKFEREKLEAVVKDSMNRKECFVKLGLHPTSNHSYRTLGYYIRLYDIDTSHFVSYGTQASKISKINSTPLDGILNGEYPLYATSKLRKRLLSEGYMTHTCSVCGLSEWQGQPIPLDLDHINGNPSDHRLENIRLICRNCHAQTDNFCGKNQKKTIDKKNNINAKIAQKETLINDKINIITNSGIDFGKHGWVTKLAALLNMPPQKINRWMKRYMTEFYETECFKRKDKMEGVV